MPVAELVEIVTAIGGALDYAHQRGLLHRDVKPGNILLTDPDDGERRILLTDFGIARPLADVSGLTATNITVGTVAYAAPEQLMDADIDGRADQYAWPPRRFTYSQVRRPTRAQTRSRSSVNTSKQNRRSSAIGDRTWRCSTRSCLSPWPRTPTTGSTGAATLRARSARGPPTPREAIAPPRRPSR
jgi:serine/threonine protein kinase